jgi:hypothetical protein
LAKAIEDAPSPIATSSPDPVQGPGDVTFATFSSRYQIFRLQHGFAAIAA